MPAVKRLATRLTEAWPFLAVGLALGVAYEFGEAYWEVETIFAPTWFSQFWRGFVAFMLAWFVGIQDDRRQMFGWAATANHG